MSRSGERVGPGGSITGPRIRDLETARTLVGVPKGPDSPPSGAIKAEEFWPRTLFRRLEDVDCG